MSKMELFLLTFPPNHLIKIIALTNVRLEAKGHENITKGELVKFFGIIILGSRYEFGSRRDLWATNSVSRFVDAPKYGSRIGIRQGRFDAIWSCIQFSECPEERHPCITGMDHRWMLVDDFIEELNDYRAASYSPLDRICVDKSTSRSYGLGFHWINIGLTKYVTMKRKPDNGCKIQDTCNGRSKVMIRLKLVKGSVDNKLLANEDPGGLHGTRVMK